MGRLENKTAIVTGGAMGIGEGIVRRFAEEGAAVVIADMNLEAAEALAAELCGSGMKAQAQRIDITDLSQWKAAAAAVKEKYGRIDILVNNAGFANTGAPLETMDLERDWHKLININLNGTFYGFYTVLPIMAEQGGAAVGSASSDAAIIDMNGVCGYTAAKGAINALTRAAAVEYAARGIRVNAVCPAATMTPAVDKLLKSMPDVMDNMLKQCVIPRFGTPLDVANLVLFLASDEAAYVNGECVRVDGGYTLR